MIAVRVTFVAYVHRGSNLDFGGLGDLQGTVACAVEGAEIPGFDPVIVEEFEILPKDYTPKPFFTPEGGI